MPEGWRGPLRHSRAGGNPSPSSSEGEMPEGQRGRPRRGGEGRANAYWRVVQFPAWMLSMIDFITSNMNFAASGRPSSLPMVAAE